MHPLNAIQSDTQRIFVGLGWDPNTPTFKDRIASLIGRKRLHHDLDLSCYFYNADKLPLGYVNANPLFQQNQNGSIYHSGDDIEGIGDGDDEQISVELANLPPNITHIVFKASIATGHNFTEINGAHMRFCDGYTERVIVDTHITRESFLDAFIFLSLHKTGDKWAYNTIAEFIKNTSEDVLQAKLTDYL